MKICKTCGKEFSSYTNRKDSPRRVNCFDCVPNKAVNSAEENRLRNNSKMNKWMAKQKEMFGYDPIELRRTARKNFILEMVNNSCQFCGYDKCERNLSFHHLKDKKMTLSSREFQFSLPIILNELKKCVVVCHNCHGEIHEGIVDKNLVEQKHTEFVSKLDNFNDKKWNQVMNPFEKVREKYEAEKQRIINGGKREENGIRLPPSKVNCGTCGKELIRTAQSLIRNNKSYCPGCVPIINKITWPSDEELSLLVKSKPMKILAKELGVSDRMIAKRCRKRKIEVPIKKFHW